ncbi:branched-chain alpha-keto acid dehydrogenase subunit E2 [Sinorhizobium fredii USDA 205]|uniref:Dihydrolipoamide acetyltransferase component of pyruvate dehydrogenase complex n=1 Tax=Rhizobium fredii TaxID=380 RepID=A0A844ACB9_RHIFR|nr:dihydrolipoamide acetyltransferase family protein [Sinorhizobium fredii]AWM26653.1 Dihydrolipoamide acyltransferase component of branched-chain alpha-keto acid dehydrogenase complex [Sinorhizobium fredii CCBAU 25509]KSV90532.1 branched-chain alpha-keto acid dehydrogenase subunit E2 [Sinorhizobium fredii USDA 205]MCG5474759.1 2-oxo acid dehydrogenase subunit E2 [Sinorhizobium fredii]MQW96942.1 2-oxo acid dehydrogenase subunit E2 [Sinorhizobium fredii]MQX09951.1 2-oxo acid dehydrogenase subun
MGEFIIKMPDVGEGVAEAELVEWHVKPGDPVREDMVLAAVMTDKATVEIPSPVSGKVLWLGAEIGDTVAVKAPLVRIETAGEDGEPPPDSVPEALAEAVLEEPVAVSAPPTAKAPPKLEKAEPRQPPAAREAPDTAKKPLASPAVRLRARESGVDLRQVTGTGPADRITHEDLDLFVRRGAEPSPAQVGLVRKTAVEEIKMAGLRRRIAEKMSLSTSRIPHITYVEEVDVTALEDLRALMNRDRKPDQPKLTILPFLMRALVRTVAEQPGVNATFDDHAGIIHRHAAVHIGIATQTPAGLTVPVVRHAEARRIWDCAAELNRLADAARTGTATRDELIGSTITISSLGALGGIASTPVINHPEVAIVGVNKIATRPIWDGAQFVPRKIMNLSSSFDHRVIDGWDAATFVQRLKTLLETPALIFVEG